MEKLIVAITEVEGLADALALARKKMLEFDIQRQGVREAARALQKHTHHDAAHRKRIWVTLPGGVPVHMLAHEALQLLDADADKLEKDIAILRQKQKSLVRLITDKSGVPDGCSPEMLKAFLTLKDGQ